MTRVVIGCGKCGTALKLTVGIMFFFFARGVRSSPKAVVQIPRNIRYLINLISVGKTFHPEKWRYDLKLILKLGKSIIRTLDLRPRAMR